MSSSGDKPERRRRRRRRRPKREPKEERLESWKRRLEKGPLRGKEIAFGPSGDVSMSDVLLDFIEPFRGLADTNEAMHRLITIALIAWNGALKPEDERQAFIQEMMGAMPADDELREDFVEIVHALIERKQKHFSEYNRMIIDYELTDRGKDYHLSVVSLQEPSPDL